MDCNFKKEVKTNIVIQKGATFERILKFLDSDNLPIDLTGYTGRGQIRPTYDSIIFHNFSVVVTNPSMGEITWSMADSVTEVIDAALAPFYVYDVEIEDSSGKVSRILQGRAKISPEVTRD